MIPKTSTRHMALLGKHLLIMKIITGIGLALLLVVGAWSAAHHESELSTTPSVSAAISATTGQGVPVSDAVERASDAVVSNAGVVDVAVLGVAGCLLGIVCCLVALALTRGLSGRMASRTLHVRPRSIAPMYATDRPYAPALSLAQLSLSRT